MSYFNQIDIKDGPSRDAFGRIRTSFPGHPQFDAQMTYDAHPLIFNTATTGDGVAAHNSTERCLRLSLTAAAAASSSALQTWEWFRYQPGRSHAVTLTFNAWGIVTDCVKIVGYTDGTNNGIQLRLGGGVAKFQILSNTSSGDEEVEQANWNIDSLDGNGPSGIDIDWATTQIFLIDLQALYVGRVRLGFVIGGKLYYAHEFNHANNLEYGYIQTVNLPVRAEISCTDTVTTKFDFYCCNISSEGGENVYDLPGYSFSQEVSLSASSGARTHAISLQPLATFNSIGNRMLFLLESIEVLGGSNPVKWELCYGQALTSASFAAVNATYSGMEYDTAGTLSGNPAIVAYTGYTGSTAANRGASGREMKVRYPLTLDVAGTARILGRWTILVWGVTGTSTCRVAVNWKEIR